MYYDFEPYNNRYNPYESCGKSFYQGRQPYRESKDQGPNPYVTNIHEEALCNNTYRTALWTGEHLQLTLMSIDVCDDIGLEMHPNVDQFLRLEQGQGLVMMGEDKNNLCYQQRVGEDYVIFVPAGTWHNLVNTGNIPIKLYSIYAPPNHPHGRVQVTKEDEKH
ncbi:MAG: cupin domain-containing protein [Clostridiales bacterium]|jgi:mannose-6-phosphate isomerase-like protein (cupin superfamily)|nr:cupin domain-containing protein [Clostridiales bacterium]